MRNSVVKAWGRGGSTVEVENGDNWVTSVILRKINVGMRLMLY